MDYNLDQRSSASRAPPINQEMPGNLWELDVAERLTKKLYSPSLFDTAQDIIGALPLKTGRGLAGQRTDAKRCIKSAQNLLGTGLQCLFRLGHTAFDAAADCVCRDGCVKCRELYLKFESEGMLRGKSA
jgi:hypothetical protein